VSAAQNSAVHDGGMLHHDNPTLPIGSTCGLPASFHQLIILRYQHSMFGR